MTYFVVLIKKEKKECIALLLVLKLFLFFCRASSSFTCWSCWKCKLASLAASGVRQTWTWYRPSTQKYAIDWMTIGRLRTTLAIRKPTIRWRRQNWLPPLSVSTRGVTDTFSVFFIAILSQDCGRNWNVQNFYVFKFLTSWNICIIIKNDALCNFSTFLRKYV